MCCVVVAWKLVGQDPSSSGYWDYGAGFCDFCGMETDAMLWGVCGEEGGVGRAGKVL